MTGLNGHSLAPKAPRGTGFALVVAIAVAGIAPVAEGAVAAELERAAVRRPAGIANPLKGWEGPVRVRILARSQPLLRAALAPDAQDLLRPTQVPLRHTFGAHISQAEQRAGRRAESLYEAAIGGLSDEAEATAGRLHRIVEAVRKRGGKVRELELAPAALIARIGAGQLERLSKLRIVQAVEPAVRPRRLSGVGTAAVGAPSWWGAGFTGGGGEEDTSAADVAIESEAADPDHPAFTDVTVDNDPTQSVTDHGTHTGGIIASRDGTYRGVAYEVDRLIGSGSTAYELGLDTPDGPGASDPAETINISFGSPAITDNQDNSDDILTAVFGVGQAFAAGNEHSMEYPTTPTVGNIGRNVLTVGGFNDVGTIDPSDDVVLGESSRGPTPGGRKKPDLTAPAGAVIAPSADWNSPPSNPDFTPMSGTSFAAPHVAGAMALLEGAGISDPMAQRAILINAARDWNGMNTGLIDWEPPQVGWRPEVGWGQLDLATALAERSNYRLGAVKAGEAAYYGATVQSGEKATLAYELRGYFVGFPNPGTQTLTYTQTNLDLHQYLSDGTEILPPAAPDHGGGPDAIDPNDTVEQVRAPLGGPHEVVYKVEAASTVEGAAAEPFAVTAAEPLTVLEPAVVRPSGATAVPSGPIRCSQPVTVETSLVNDSPELSAGNARVALELPAGVTLDEGAAEQQVSGGNLAESQVSEQHSWTVEATTDGPKQLTVAGTGGALGTDFRRTSKITLNADCVPPGTVIEAGPNGNTNDPAPQFTFSSVGGGSGFECSVDGAPYESCVSPISLGGLGEGTHSFTVRAFDDAGNVDQSPAFREFAIDRTVKAVGLRVRPKRKSGRGRKLGSVRVALGEPGTVRIGATASVGGRAISLRRRQIKLAASGHERVKLIVRRNHRRLIRGAHRRGREIAIAIVATFFDDHGNEAKRSRSFFIR